MLNKVDKNAVITEEGLYDKAFSHILQVEGGYVNDPLDRGGETNFGITFPMTEKINVIGANSHPFYKWARKDFGMSAIPKWNFHKIVIGKKGKIEDTFASFTKPTSKKFIKLIEKLI